MDNFSFNLFKVKGGAKAPSFTKESVADYVGSSQSQDVSNILGKKSVSQGGLGYIKIRVSLGNKVHFGALFKNEKKSSEIQPDFTGSLDLDDKGEDRLRLAAWIKTGEKAGEYLSVQASPFMKGKSEQQEAESDDIGF